MLLAILNYSTATLITLQAETEISLPNCKVHVVKAVDWLLA